MKGIMKKLPPLAPDYSGASSVFYTLGGAIIINGADGCIGNITGYDEPRFFDYNTFIYSSGLREVNAITGDEDVLKKKIESSVGDKDIQFIVILGTPNSAVIASDHRGVSEIIMKEKKIPVFPINTTGIDTYEKGAANAFLELAKRFVKPVDKTGGVNIIGATPMDYWDNRQTDAIIAALKNNGLTINSCWGMDDSINSIEQSLAADINLVVSYSGLKAARYLQRNYGIPFVAGVPVGHIQTKLLAAKLRNESNPVLPFKDKGKDDNRRILIVGDQIWAISVRDYFHFEKKINNVRTASFFSLDKDIKKEEDLFIQTEKALSDMINSFHPDIVVGDPLCKSFIKDCNIKFAEVPHMAVSSRIHWDHDVMYAGEEISFSGFI